MIIILLKHPFFSPGELHQPFDATHRGELLSAQNLHRLPDLRSPPPHRGGHGQPRRRDHLPQRHHGLRARREAGAEEAPRVQPRGRHPEAAPQRTGRKIRGHEQIDLGL